MPDKLLLLTLDTRIKVRELQRIAGLEGVDILIYCTLRTCSEQAKIYRQSRTRREIEAKIQSYRDRDLPFLAESLISVGPQSGTLGKHVTKAGPGESFHQYGEAADGVPIVNGKAIWDSSSPLWNVYGEAAEFVGLFWSGRWKTFKEMPHVQNSKVSNPLSLYKDPAQIYDMLLKVNSLTK